MRQIIYLRRELLALILNNCIYHRASGELTIDMPSFLALLNVAEDVRRVEGGITSSVSLSGSAMTNNTIQMEVLLAVGLVDIDGFIEASTNSIGVGNCVIVLPQCIIISEANTNVGRGISTEVDIESADMSGAMVESYRYYTEPNDAEGTTVLITSDYVTKIDNTVYIGGTPNGT